LNVSWAVGGERIEVVGSQSWYAGQWTTSPPQSVNSWRERVGEVASLYSGQTGPHEIWNESNSAKFWSEKFASGFLFKGTGDTSSLRLADISAMALAAEVTAWH